MIRVAREAGGDDDLADTVAAASARARPVPPGDRSDRTEGDDVIVSFAV
jgi:hypothetical protein